MPFVDYMKKEGEKRGLKLIGGILIGEDKLTNWKYSPTYVDNINDTSGWDVFNPKAYSE